MQSTCANSRMVSPFATAGEHRSGCDGGVTPQSLGAGGQVRGQNVFVCVANRRNRAGAKSKRLCGDIMAGNQEKVLSVLACQIDVPEDMRSAEDRDHHLARIAELIDGALSDRTAEVVMLPELSSVSYSRHCFSEPEIFAEDAEGRSFQILARVAKKRRVHILYGAPCRREDGCLSISQFVIDREGRPIGAFEKLHLAQFGASMEKDYFSPGKRLLVLDIKGFRLAPVICYDLRFAGLATELALGRNVDAILHSVAFCRDESFYSWRPFVITRALENEVYWLSLNRAGEKFGASIFCPPWVDEKNRETVCGAGEELIWFDISKEVISQARHRYTFRNDRLANYSALPE